MISLLIVLAAAAGGDAPESTQRGPETAKKERKICRTTDVIGSRVKAVRTCHTKAEWEEFDAETRATLRGFQQDRQGNPTNGG